MRTSTLLASSSSAVFAEYSATICGNGVRGGELVRIRLLAEGFDLGQFVAAELVDFFVECQGGSTFCGETKIIKDGAWRRLPVAGITRRRDRTRRLRTSAVFIGHKLL